MKKSNPRILKSKSVKLAAESLIRSIEDHKANEGSQTLNMFVAASVEIGTVVSEKQQAYGDSFGKSGDVLKILYPNGISTDQYGDMLSIVRILDKLFRIATNKDALGESPYKDIAGYGLLGVVRDEKTKQKKQLDEMFQPKMQKLAK